MENNTPFTGEQVESFIYVDGTNDMLVELKGGRAIKFTNCTMVADSRFSGEELPAAATFTVDFSSELLYSIEAAAPTVTLGEPKDFTVEVTDTAMAAHTYNVLKQCADLANPTNVGPQQ